MKQDTANMQEEVQKALKIHRANKELKAKNDLLKKEMDRLQHECRTQVDSKQLKIDTMGEQIE